MNVDDSIRVALYDAFTEDAQKTCEYDNVRVVFFQRIKQSLVEQLGGSIIAPRNGLCGYACILRTGERVCLFAAGNYAADFAAFYFEIDMEE